MKLSPLAAFVTAACFSSAPVLSNPVNPTVVNGNASFNQSGNVLTVTNSNGSYNDTVTYSLPSNATPGVYTVLTRLSSNYGTSQRDASFTVQ